MDQFAEHVAVDDLLGGTAVPLAPQLNRVRTRFAGVDTWVFDLDNTLYPHDSDLWPQIDARITHYLADLFGIDGLSARALQKFYYRRYGTTLHGLLADHAVDHEPFLRFVHRPSRACPAASSFSPTARATTRSPPPSNWGSARPSRTCSTSSPRN